MLFRDNGEAAPGLFVLGRPQTPVYLFAGEVPVLFDGGMAHMADAYLAHAREVLGERAPAMLLHTHMHFDHCGATSFFKREYPKMRIGASEWGAEIIAKPKARELIRELSDDAARVFASNYAGEPGRFSPFEVDLILKDGDEIELGGGETLKVIATPGHTRDFLSYWIPSRRILVASEAAGCAHHSGQINVEFASDYDSYLATIEKLEALDALALCQGHHFVFTGDDVRKFLRESLKRTLWYRKRAEELLSELNGNLDAVASRFRDEEWAPLPPPKQPEAAYFLNTYGRLRSIVAINAGKTGIPP